MLIRKISSWESWKTKISEINAEEIIGKEKGYVSNLLFRGHGCGSWELQSTLERKGIGLSSIKKFSKQIKTTKLAFESYLGSSWSSEFKANDAPLPPEDYEFMVYLRHHGYPTPLLDWSRSAYIASFFALQHPSLEDMVAVYSFREYAGEGKSGRVGGSNIVGCGPTIRTHKRHYVQQAEYTYCRQNIDGEWLYSGHEQALEESSGGQDIVQKYVLPACIRGEALRDLDSMNINAYTLFGSEEGLAEMLSNREHGYDT